MSAAGAAPERFRAPASFSQSSDRGSWLVLPGLFAVWKGSEDARAGESRATRRKSVLRWVGSPGSTVQIRFPDLTYECPAAGSRFSLNLKQRETISRGAADYSCVAASRLLAPR